MQRTIIPIFLCFTLLCATFAEAGPLRRAKRRPVRQSVPVKSVQKTETKPAESTEADAEANVKKHPVGFELLNAAPPEERWKQAAAEYGEYDDTVHTRIGSRHVGYMFSGHYCIEEGWPWPDTIPPYTDWRKFKMFRLDDPQPLGKPFGKLMRESESTPVDQGGPARDAIRQAVNRGTTLPLMPEEVRNVPIMKQVMPKYFPLMMNVPFTFDMSFMR